MLAAAGMSKRNAFQRRYGVGLEFPAFQPFAVHGGSTLSPRAFVGGTSCVTDHSADEGVAADRDSGACSWRAGVDAVLDHLRARRSTVCENDVVLRFGVVGDVDADHQQVVIAHPRDAAASTVHLGSAVVVTYSRKTLSRPVAGGAP